MNTMTISPIQNNYVTKSEFNEFRIDTDNNFRIIREDIKDIKNQFSELRTTIREDVRKTNEEFRASIREDFKNQTGILIETFQHNLKASMEYMDSKLDKKLDRDEFYEYMNLHFPKTKKQIKIK